jgi:hypothetical protein
MPVNPVELNRMSLRQFRELFTSLTVPDQTSIRSLYRASFVGPAWLRTSANPALAITGLGGWWGKEFHDDGTAINIVLRAGKFSTRFPMKFVKAKSFIDHKDGLALHYQQGNPFPWMYVVDELRRMDEQTLLGMTIPNVSGLRGLAFPFILQKSENNQPQGRQRSQG